MMDDSANQYHSKWKCQYPLLAQSDNSNIENHRHKPALYPFRSSNLLVHRTADVHDLLLTRPSGHTRFKIGFIAASASHQHHWGHPLACCGSSSIPATHLGDVVSQVFGFLTHACKVGVGYVEQCAHHFESHARVVVK
jgi:hypothetical protein